MIGRAKKLSGKNKDVLIAYLHFLHLVEHLGNARSIKAHWVNPDRRFHWAGAA